MNVSKIFCIVLFSSFLAYSAAHRFIHGRPKGGFLGSPEADSQLGSIKQAISITDKWYTQRLDHFKTSDRRTFRQKYYTNAEYYLEGGPLFILIGGESPIGKSWMEGGAWIDYAKRYNAYCVQLEHRFYGSTQPLGSLSTDNLKYLTIKQALADLADFIEYFRYGQTFSQVIAFGGSYSGSLAAFLRLKYPNIVNGAVASSAPVNLLVNYKGYLESVDSALRYYYPNGDCNDAIKQATAAIKNKLNTFSGQTDIKRQFQLCYDIDRNNAKDVSSLYASLAHNFKTITQYNNDNILSDTSDITVSDLCSIMVNSFWGDPIDRYAEVNTKLLDAQSYRCVDPTYNTWINELKQTSWTSTVAIGGERQWMYHICSELGGFQSSESPNQPFGNEFPIDYWTEECTDVFGSKFSSSFVEASVGNAATEYGGLTTNSSRIIFINGNIDPWHKMGILNNAGPNNTVIFMNGTAHCADMYTPTYFDVSDLTLARSRISYTIGLWLQAPEPTHTPPTPPNNSARLLSTYILGLLTILASAYNFRN